MSLFERFKPSIKRSFALRAFNACETEINEHFWSFKVISEHAGYIAREKKKTDSKFPTADIFEATGPDARRIPPTVADWLDARDELENWLRLSALVSAAAYHEAYLRQIIRSALMSDPMARAGHPKTIDGIFFLKRGIELPYEHELSLITKGEWSARVASFERIFGSPPIDAFPIAKLEEIRRTRNDYAHGFGRALDAAKPSEIRTTPARRLSQSKFIELIGVISKSAKYLDRYILENFIGDFELVHAFHIWRDQKPLKSNIIEAKDFKIYMNSKLAVSKSRAFCDELIDYYNRF